MAVPTGAGMSSSAARDSGTASTQSLMAKFGWGQKPAPYNHTDVDNYADTDYVLRVVERLKKRYTVSHVWLASLCVRPLP